MWVKVHFTNVITEAVVRRCSVKEAVFKNLQYLQKNISDGVSF